MWQANILEVNKENNRVIVEYTNGVDTFTDAISLMSQDELKQTILDKINSLEKISTNLPTVGTVDLTPAVKNTPTVDVASAWKRNYDKLQRIKVAISLGVLTGNEQEVVDLENEVKEGVSISYFNA